MWHCGNLAGPTKIQPRSFLVGRKNEPLDSLFQLRRLEVSGSIQDTKRQIFALFKPQSRLMRCGRADGRLTPLDHLSEERSEVRSCTGSVFARCIDPRVGLLWVRKSCRTAGDCSVRLYYNIFIIQYWHTVYPSSCTKDTNAKGLVLLTKALWKWPIWLLFTFQTLKVFTYI